MMQLCCLLACLFACCLQIRKWNWVFRDIGKLCGKSIGLKQDKVIQSKLQAARELFRFNYGWVCNRFDLPDVESGVSFAWKVHSAHTHSSFGQPNEYCPVVDFFGLLFGDKARQTVLSVRMSRGHLTFPGSTGDGDRRGHFTQMGW